MERRAEDTWQVKQRRVRRRRAMNKEDVIGWKAIGYREEVLGFKRSVYSGTAEHQNIVYVLAINGLTGKGERMHLGTGDHLNEEGYLGTGRQEKRMRVTGIGETATWMLHFDAIGKSQNIEVKLNPRGPRLTLENVAALAMTRRTASSPPWVYSIPVRYPRWRPVLWRGPAGRGILALMPPTG